MQEMIKILGPKVKKRGSWCSQRQGQGTMNLQMEIQAVEENTNREFQLINIEHPPGCCFMSSLVWGMGWGHCQAFKEVSPTQHYFLMQAGQSYTEKSRVDQSRLFRCAPLWSAPLAPSGSISVQLWEPRGPGLHLPASSFSLELAPRQSKAISRTIILVTLVNTGLHTCS